MKVKRLFFIFIIILMMSCNLANADPTFKTQKVVKTDITVQAKVPDDFDRTIYINFVSEDGTNSEFTLNKENNYYLKGKIKVGKQKINFIKIANNDDEKYEHSYSDQYIENEEGKILSFEVIVALSRNYVELSQNDTNGNAEVGENQSEYNEEQYKEDTEEKKNDDNISSDKEEIEKYTDNRYKENKLIKNESIRSIISDGILILILLLIYNFIKIKKSKGDM